MPYRLISRSTPGQARGDAWTSIPRAAGRHARIDAARVAKFGEATEMFGALPEFDSMAVATLLTGLEDRLAILIEDDDVEAEDFATFGSLLAIVRRKTLS